MELVVYAIILFGEFRSRRLSIFDAEMLALSLLHTFGDVTVKLDIVDSDNMVVDTRYRTVEDYNDFGA
jgi:hypothetical protein